LNKCAQLTIYYFFIFFHCNKPWEVVNLNSHDSERFAESIIDTWNTYAIETGEKILLLEEFHKSLSDKLVFSMYEFSELDFLDVVEAKYFTSDKTESIVTEFSDNTKLSDLDYPLGSVLLMIIKTIPVFTLFSFISKLPEHDKVYYCELVLQLIRKAYYLRDNELILFDRCLVHFYKLLIYQYFVKSTGFNYLGKSLHIIKYLELCIKKSQYYTCESFLRVFGSDCPALKKNYLSRTNENYLFLNSEGDIGITIEEFLNKGISYELYAFYQVSSLDDICLVSLYELIEKGMLIKSCEHCGKWFVEYSKNEKYCNGYSPIYSGLSCKKAARNEKEKARVSKDGINSMLTSLRQMFYNEQRIDERTVFNEKVEDGRQNVKKGTAKEKDYILWLISNFKTEKTRKELCEKWLPSQKEATPTK